MLPPSRGAGAAPELDRVVVAGGGPAAIAAVEELRALGFGGTVTVLAGELAPPYDRIACSKGLIDGRQRPVDARLPIPTGADWRPGEWAAGIDHGRRAVLGSSGVRYPYDGLVIATGGRTAVADGWPADDPGVFPLRTMDDAVALRRALPRAGTVVVVGGGLTGCEVACGILQAARRVVVVDPHPTLLYRSVGEQLGAVVTEEHRAAGVELRLGRSVRDIRRRRGQFQVGLDDETSVRADLVVLATGDHPRTEWLSGSGFDTVDGVLCDESLRVVGGCGAVVAAGSVARWPNLRHGGPPDRCGHWIAALEQGGAAARTLLTGAAAPPVTLLPRYSSHQHRLRILVAGQPGIGTDVRLTRPRRGGMHGAVRSGLLATFHRSGQLVAVAAVNAPRAFAAAAGTLAAARPADVSVPERDGDLACAPA